jgi:hypothetical protein
VRQIAREMGISRNTVRKYLGQAERMRQVRPHKRRPVFEQVGPHPWTLPAARMGCCNTPGRPTPGDPVWSRGSPSPESRCSANSREPFASAGRTVTCLRSPLSAAVDSRAAF